LDSVYERRIKYIQNLQLERSSAMKDARIKSKARRQEEVIKRLLKKASQLEKAKTFKKVLAKEIPEEKRDLVREGAERLINDLRRLCRDGSLIKLVDMVARKVRGKEYSPIVLKVLLERIRRNQWDRLSDEDKCLVVQTEASLAKQIN